MINLTQVALSISPLVLLVCKWGVSESFNRDILIEVGFHFSQLPDLLTMQYQFAASLGSKPQSLAAIEHKIWHIVCSVATGGDPTVGLAGLFEEFDRVVSSREPLLPDWFVLGVSGLGPFRLVYDTFCIVDYTDRTLNSNILSVSNRWLSAEAGKGLFGHKTSSQAHCAGQCIGRTNACPAPPDQSMSEQPVFVVSERPGLCLRQNGSGQREIDHECGSLQQGEGTIVNSREKTNQGSCPTSSDGRMGNHLTAYDSEGEDEVADGASDSFDEDQGILPPSGTSLNNRKRQLKTSQNMNRESDLPSKSYRGWKSFPIHVDIDGDVSSLLHCRLLDSS